MSRHSWDRLVAWLIDWLSILAWVAVIAAVGVPLFLLGVTRGLTTGAANVIASTILVVPVTIALAWQESGIRQATLGKRIRHLQVADADIGSRVPFQRTLLRNSVKIAVPWILGHAVAYELFRSSSSNPPGWLWVATAAAYVLPAASVASLFVRRGRTPYDWISRTTVIRNLPPNKNQPVPTSAAEGRTSPAAAPTPRSTTIPPT